MHSYYNQNNVTDGGGMFGPDENQNDNALFGSQGNFAGGSAPGAGHPVSAPVAAPSKDELLDIKQQALQALSPLISHLEQSPEEKFKTTMMMIQASDDQGLIKEAYEAANRISDEKARAQALLDVVNEINYFTQQHHN